MAEMIKEDDLELRTGTEPAERVEVELTDEEERRLVAPDAEADDDAAAEAGAANDEEREAIRERRRAEKAERKQRREQAISRDKLELDFLRQQNEQLERRLAAQEQRSVNTDLMNLDAQLQRATNEAAMAERVIAKAVEAGNGNDVAQAMRYRDQAIARAQQLAQVKAQATAPRPVEPQIDNKTLHYAQQFIADHPWYDAQGRDEDSAIVLTIDQGLVKDGFNPQTEEYWDELRSRVARRLPEKTSKAPASSARAERGTQSARPVRGGPAVGSGREHAPTSTRTEVYISPERKQALVDAGVWDDPVLRQRYVKRYMEYDRTNRA